MKIGVDIGSQFLRLVSLKDGIPDFVRYLPHRGIPPGGSGGGIPTPGIAT